MSDPKNWATSPSTKLSLSEQGVAIPVRNDGANHLLSGRAEVTQLIFRIGHDPETLSGDVVPVTPSPPYPGPNERRSQPRPGPDNDEFFRAGSPTVGDTETGNAQGARDRLSDAHLIFRKWLSDEYDVAILNAVLATAVSSSLLGDPLWLLVISGAGNAKTETVSALSEAGAVVTSTIASEGALLSATSKKERAKTATGGLLRSMGKRSILVLKDFTTILSMSDRNSRSTVLAALREVYDGHWSRNVGSDGGQTLEWRGHLTLIGACTTAWDSAHGVIGAMGDRFVLIRSDSTNMQTRLATGRQAIQNTGHEVAMRRELGKAVAAVVKGVGKTLTVEVGTAEQRAILAVANVVTLARTSVEYDYRGKLVRVHAAEAPTRFAKQLTQIARGALAIGLDQAEALALMYRCARDSMPPLRLRCLLDITVHAASGTNEVARRVQMPWSAVDRELQALVGLRLLKYDEVNESPPSKTSSATKWRYTLADDVDRYALNQLGP